MSEKVSTSGKIELSLRYIHRHHFMYSGYNSELTVITKFFSNCFCFVFVFVFFVHVYTLCHRHSEVVISKHYC